MANGIFFLCLHGREPLHGQKIPCALAASVPVTGKPSLHMGGQQGEAGMRHRQAWSSGAAALSQGHGHLVPTLLPARAVCAVGGGQAQQYGGGWGKRPTQVSFPPPPVLSQ